MTYQQLDAIADLYIPVLVALTLLWFAKLASRIGFKDVFVEIGTTVLGAIYIYALMFADLLLGAFPKFGLDYSTHTALALVFVVTLSFISKRACVLCVLSMLFYCALMLYQGYHSVLDMVLTAVVVMPVLIWLKWLSFLKIKI